MRKISVIERGGKAQSRSYMYSDADRDGRESVGGYLQGAESVLRRQMEMDSGTFPDWE
jgi:hypothetical protein